MKFTHFFIRRPIFAAVLSILIMVVGLIALFRLPIAQYPEVVPPTVVVRAIYPGASADVVASTVATPIEQEVNGVENMLYMSSSCTSDGVMSLTVTFKTGTDLDKAQVQVQNRVAIAEPRLPEEVRRLGITTTKRSPSITMVVHLLSPSGKYDQLYLGNYAFLQVKDQLARLPGVGEVMLFGARDYSMRIWLDPNKAASRNLTATEIVNAIREQNVQVAAGVFGQPPQNAGNNFQLTAQVQGRLASEEEFGNIVLRTGANGEITRLRDVARVELGAKDYSLESYVDGIEAAAIGIFQLPGSNAIETADAVKKAMADLSKSFPEGLEYTIVYDTTVFVSESIKAVLVTLLEAMLLVVIVVVLFLQNWRASLIPLLAVPVSLIGTLAVMQAFGFSLNNLSLFGLVLAIGIVVDDAIVVVENVERNLAEGLSPVEATKKAMDEVSGAVVAIALVLSAVFIPTAFMSGLTGQFFQQFALTVAVSTVISAFNSLTLSPALAAILLKGHHAPKDGLTRFLDRTIGWLFRGFERLFEGSRRGYLRGLNKLVRHTIITVILYGGLLALTWVGFSKVPVGFVPTQDKGYLFGYVQLPDGASLQRTAKVSAQVAKLFKDIPGVANVVELPGLSIMGFGNAANASTMFVCLEPFDKRLKNGRTGDVIANEMRLKIGGIQDGFVGVFGAPPVDGLGSVGGFKMQVQDRGGLGANQLEAGMQKLIGAANQNASIAGAFTTYRANVPQVMLDVDREKAKLMQVNLTDVWSTLQVYLGSLYVNDLTLFGRSYQVTAQADAPFRAQPEDVANLKLRGPDGQMIPLSTLVNVREIAAPTAINRYNMYAAGEISGGLAPGVSSGDAIKIMSDLAQKELPRGMGFEWTELSLLEVQSGNSALYVFPLCVLLVFLVLAAQYESWSLPLAIILIVPMCLFSAIMGVWAMGMDNNIFTQIGLVVLVGLACKNAVLIVEFAKQLQDQGMSRVEAALEASKLRLRPIVMTSMAFIFGVLPLMIAEGAGSEMRRALGTAVVFGMLGVTFFGIFLTPVFYVIIRKVVEGKAKPATGGAHGGIVNPKTVSLVTGLLAVTVLSGCAAGPNYEQPKPNVSAAFANGATTNYVATEAIKVWWESFNDPQLNQLVEQSMPANYDLRVATARVQEARALRQETRFDAFPTVRASGGYTRSMASEIKAPAPDRKLNYYDAGFDATWELDIFGRVRRSLEASKADLQATEENRRSVMVTLASEVARNYFELRGAQLQLQVAKQNATNQTDTLDVTLAKLNAGRANDLEANQARSQLNATLANIPPLEAAVKRSQHRLAVLTGKQPTALDKELAEAKPLPQLPALVNIGNPEELLRRRPDVRAAERALAAATARVGIQTADLFPRVSFNGNVALEANTLSGLSQGGATTYSFGPRISWAAFDLGRVRARIKAADARTEASLAQYEQTVLTALEETENALVEYGQEQARRDFLRVSANAAEAAVNLARQRYDAGVSEFLTVLDAERRLFEVQDQLARSESRTATTLVTVYKALGDGWLNEGEAQTAAK